MGMREYPGICMYGHTYTGGVLLCVPCVVMYTHRYSTTVVVVVDHTAPWCICLSVMVYTYAGCVVYT